MKRGESWSGQNQRSWEEEEEKKIEIIAVYNYRRKKNDQQGRSKGRVIKSGREGRKVERNRNTSRCVTVIGR